VNAEGEIQHYHLASCTIFALI